MTTAKLAVLTATLTLLLTACTPHASFRTRTPVTTTLPTTPATIPAPVEPTTTPVDIAYRSCVEARDAGAAPLHRGDPGYSTRLDGDGDGTACE